LQNSELKILEFRIFILQNLEFRILAFQNLESRFWQSLTLTLRHNSTEITRIASQPLASVSVNLLCSQMKFETLSSRCLARDQNLPTINV